MIHTFHNRDKQFNSLYDKLVFEHNEALKKGNKELRIVLGLLLNSATTKAKEDKNREITDKDILDAAVQQEKRCIETIKLLEGKHLSNNQEFERDKLIEELNIIKPYLPEYFSDTEYLSFIKGYASVLQEQGYKGTTKQLKKDIISFFNIHLANNNLRADMKKFMSILNKELDK